jgi:hypothetical protein
MDGQGIFNFLSEQANGVDNLAERTAINAAFFGMAPEWLVTKIQDTMRSIGIPQPSAISPSGMSQLGATTLALGGIMAALFSLTFGFIYSLFQRYRLFTISLLIILVGLTLYKTDNKTPLRTLLRWVENGSYYILMGVLVWIIIWLIGIKQVPFFKPDESDSPSEVSLSLVTFII